MDDFMMVLLKEIELERRSDGAMPVRAKGVVSGSGRRGAGLRNNALREHHQGPPRKRLVTCGDARIRRCRKPGRAARSQCADETAIPIRKGRLRLAAIMRRYRHADGNAVHVQVVAGGHGGRAH
jgi:hypothetical protein